MQNDFLKHRKSIVKIQKTYQDIAFVYELNAIMYQKLAKRLQELETKLDHSGDTDFLVDTTIAAIYLELDVYMERKGNVLLFKKQQDVLSNKIKELSLQINKDNIEFVQDRLEGILAKAKEYDVISDICQLQLDILKVQYDTYKKISIVDRVENFKEEFSVFIAGKVNKLLSDDTITSSFKQKLSTTLIDSWENNKVNYVSPKVIVYLLNQEESDLLIEDKIVIRALPSHESIYPFATEAVKKEIDSLDKAYRNMQNRSFFPENEKTEVIGDRRVLEELNAKKEISKKYRIGLTGYSSLHFRLVLEEGIFMQYFHYHPNNKNPEGDLIKAITFDEYTPFRVKQMMALYITEAVLYKLEVLHWVNLPDNVTLFYHKMLELYTLQQNQPETFLKLTNDYLWDMKIREDYMRQRKEYMKFSEEERPSKEWIENWRKKTLRKINKQNTGCWFNVRITNVDTPILKLPACFPGASKQDFDGVMKWYKPFSNVSAIQEYLAIDQRIEAALAFDPLAYDRELKREQIQFEKQQAEELNKIAEKKALLLNTIKKSR